ncbi:MAG: hypothetical protein NC094_04750 [Bacteroidales bacterium]|nr:hypothetical protein [Lachnoclostridium sp.]MCM1464708.1 hypothetical protein [Bacteroidales bacterium]
MTLNRKTKMRVNLVLGIALAVFGVLMFTLPFIRNSIFWVSLLFGAISIGMQFYVQSKAFEGNQAVSKFYGFPIARIGLIYMAVQLVLSLLMSALGRWVPIWVVIVIYVMAIAIAAIGLIAADTMREEVEKLDQKLSDNASFMRNLRSKVGMILSQCEMEDVRNEMKSFAENLRFSDPISSEAITGIEQELFSCVDDLQKSIIDNDAKTALSLCHKADAILAERNQQCKLNKK